MSKPDARVVAWQWYTSGPQFCTTDDKERWVAAGDGFAKGYTIPLIPLSLLAEAESRVVVLDRLHDEAAIQRDTLQMRLADMQAKLDAVGDGAALQQAIEEAIAGKFVHVTTGGTLRLILKRAKEIRSAALGGESPASDEVG